MHGPLVTLAGTCIMCSACQCPLCTVGASVIVRHWRLRHQL